MERTTWVYLLSAPDSRMGALIQSDRDIRDRGGQINVRIAFFCSKREGLYVLDNIYGQECGRFINPTDWAEKTELQREIHELPIRGMNFACVTLINPQALHELDQPMLAQLKQYNFHEHKDAFNAMKQVHFAHLS